jgi:hypothetical protein
MTGCLLPSAATAPIMAIEMNRTAKPNIARPVTVANVILKKFFMFSAIESKQRYYKIREF